MSNERYLVGFMSQVTSLSSGMYCSLTKYNKYSQIDRIRAAFEDYCYNHIKEYQAWTDAWNDWIETVDLVQIVGE